MQRMYGWMVGAALAGTLSVVPAHAVDVEDAVAQIVVVSQQPDWREPWRRKTVARGSGTGFVIAGRRLLTNAHVVSWPREIHVRRTRDEKPYPARVVHVGHDCDLAILEITDRADAFFADTPALALGELPALRSEIFTYGYPVGGRRISSTRGVVSRIEMNRYAHTAHRRFLTIQTDAAINPGNSGGPVLQGDRVVGVAFQGYQQLENSGYVIPMPVVRHFLEDIEDGTYDGFIVQEFGITSLRNPALRRMLGSQRDDQGILISLFLPGSRMAEFLKEDDVIYRVGTTRIGTDGTALFEGNRLNWTAALMAAQAGDELEFEILRDGKVQALSFPVFPYRRDAAQGLQYDVRPKYLVYGGMVFTPLSRNYLIALGQAGRQRDLLYHLQYHGMDHPDAWRPEPVVLSHILPHTVNADVTITGPAVVERVNGAPVAGMADLAQAFQSATGTCHVIEFAHGQMEALDREACDAAQDRILRRYGIAEGARL